MLFLDDLQEFGHQEERPLLENYPHLDDSDDIGVIRKHSSRGEWATNVQGYSNITPEPGSQFVT